MNDEQLAEMLKKKDESALEAIMERFAPLVSAVIYSVSKGSLTPADIDETAADVFFCLWRNAAKVQKESLKGYLCIIAKTKAKDKIKSLKIPDIIDIDDIELKDEFLIADNTDRQVLHDDITAALAQFQKTDRDILIRYYYYYQSAPRIAEITGLKPETVKSKIKRAKVKIKAFLKERGY